MSLFNALKAFFAGWVMKICRNTSSRHISIFITEETVNWPFSTWLGDEKAVGT